MDGVLVPRSPALDEAQAAVEAAARDFANPDPLVRARGERVFLAVRQAEQAIDYACFFLTHSNESFVLFESLGMVLAALPTISPASAYPISPHVPSLAVLRDYLAHVTIHRSSPHNAASSSSSVSRQTSDTSWPLYVQRRAFQAIAAVGKKSLAVDLALASQQSPPASLASVAEEHASRINSLLSSLLQPHAANSGLVWIGLGLVHAMIDEYALATAATADPDAPFSPGGGDKGKARAVEKGSPVGLTATMHLLCKAAFQVCYFECESLAR